MIVVVFCSTSALATSPARIDDAIAQAKAWLYDQQSPDHTWEREFSGHGDQKTGQTALVVYALLSAGESRTDPRLAGTVEYLEKTPATGVYALGMRCQVWLMLPPTPEVRAAAVHDAKVLLQSVHRTGNSAGFYDYNPSGDKDYSHSRSQYAALGLWAAARMGVPVPRQYWQLVEKAWTAHQDAGGGWNYIFKRDQYPVTAGMTAVGVATLLITRDFLHRDDAVKTAPTPGGAAIERGIQWLSDHASRIAADDASPRAYPFATLYAIERVGLFSGTRYFGDVDWYDKGARFLIDQQRRDGSFPAEFGSKVVSTSFALLFLSRGAYSLMMGKLDYSSARSGRSAPRWNQRPRDLDGLARWTGRQVEHELNWQVMPLDGKVRDWHDAPILYISGGQALEFSSGQQAKIRQFVDEGGLVLGDAEGGSAAFARSFQAMGQRLFPAYEFRALPADHVIYTGELFRRSTWKRSPSVRALSNGVREMFILLADSDPARAWQLEDFDRRKESFELAADIYFYAVDKTHLRRRGQNDLVVADPNVQPTRTIKLARLQYAGNWDPEPGGWRRLAAVLRNQRKIELIVEPVKLGEGKLAGHSIAHLTGTAEFELDAKARGEMRQFIDRGGTLVIDAAGGSSAFATSAEKELAAMFPGQSAQLADLLPADCPLYNSYDADGAPAIPIGWRAFARVRFPKIKGPRLRGITIGNRLAVIYSREDLSAGLVGEAVEGIIGYDPATATALMGRIICVSAR